MTRYELIKCFPAGRFSNLICELLDVKDEVKREAFTRMLKEEVKTQELQTLFSITLENEKV